MKISLSPLFPPQYLLVFLLLYLQSRIFRNSLIFRNLVSFDTLIPQNQIVLLGGKPRRELNQDDACLSSLGVQSGSRIIVSPVQAPSNESTHHTQFIADLVSGIGSSKPVHDVISNKLKEFHG